MVTCYIKGCDGREEHGLRVDSGIVVAICDYHYDGTVEILNEWEDTVQSGKREVLNKIRNLSIKE